MTDVTFCHLYWRPNKQSSLPCIIKLIEAIVGLKFWPLQIIFFEAFIGFWCGTKVNE